MIFASPYKKFSLYHVLEGNDGIHFHDYLFLSESEEIAQKLMSHPKYGIDFVELERFPEVFGSFDVKYKKVVDFAHRVIHESLRSAKGKQEPKPKAEKGS